MRQDESETSRPPGDYNNPSLRPLGERGFPVQRPREGEESRKRCLAGAYRESDSWIDIVSCIL